MKHIVLTLAVMLTSSTYTYTHNEQALTQCSAHYPFADDKDDTLANRMLLDAVRSYDDTLLANALKDGANTDLLLANGWTALHEACANLHTAGIQALLPQSPFLQRRVRYYHAQDSYEPARPLECILWSLATTHNVRMAIDQSYTMFPATQAYCQHWQQYTSIFTLLVNQYTHPADQDLITEFYNQFITLPGVYVPDQE